MKKTILFLILLIGLTARSQTIKNADAAEFKKQIELNKGVLIDLRTSDEIKSKGKIKNAQQIDFLSKEAEATIETLDKNKTYLLYCAGGGRSAQCAELMQKLGFKEVFNLEKGFGDWKNKGFETEQPKQ
jgi:rhodanese-related sulfurtransferase